MGCGVVLSGGFDGHAGGRAVRGSDPRLGARRRRPGRRGRLRRLGLRRADRGRQRGGDARSRASRCSTPRGSARGRSRRSSAGSRRASCTPPIWPRTRCTARWARRAPTPRSRAGRAAHAGRDERRRRLRGRGAARLARGARRPSRSRSSSGATRRTTPRRPAARPTPSGSPARSRTGWACRTSRSDLRDEFRAGVVDPFLAGYAAGETPNPCVGCNGHVRLDAMLELADAARRAPTWRPATTRG